MIHPTAIIHPSAQIGDDVEVGPYAIIGEQTRLERGTKVGPYAVIEYADVGEDCRIYSSAFVGTPPQDLKYKGENTRIVLGKGTTVRECVTLNRGTIAGGETKIGENCLFMAYSHVAHDCQIGKEVIVANSVAIAGHVEIDNYAVIGGMVGIHQFVRVGALVMIGAGAMVSLDIPPYCQAVGDRAYLCGLNSIGLRRRGFPNEVIAQLKKVYRDFFQSQRTAAEVIADLSRESSIPEVEYFVNFIKNSHRGVCRPRRLLPNRVISGKSEESE